jgi:hypothetical protein
MPSEIKVVNYDLDQIRGHTTHVIMDSPNYYQGDSEDWIRLWGMVSHVVSPTLARPCGYGLTVITHLNQRVLKTIAEHGRNREWSTHVVPIHDAIKSGFPNVDLTDLSEPIRRREYMTKFNVPTKAENRFKAVYKYARTWA